MSSNITDLHTNEGGEEALTTALAQCPDSARTIITSCFALLIRQQHCLLEALVSQPTFQMVQPPGFGSAHMEWTDPSKIEKHRVDRYFISRQKVLDLIREYRGEAPAEASPPIDENTQIEGGQSGC